MNGATSLNGPGAGSRVMLLVYGATASMVIGVSSIMPLLPTMAEHFGVSLTHASLIITLYTLPGIVFSPLAGLLADRLGRKVVLVPSLLLFAVAGAACGLAQDFNTLVFLRFFQGIGAAPLGVLNVTIIADAYSGPVLARMVGYNTTVLSVCTALCPGIGGLLGQMGWQWPFFLPILALIPLFFALRMPLTNPSRDVSFGQYARGLSAAFHNRQTLALLCITLLTFMLLYGPVITCFPALAHHRFDAAPALIGSIMILSSVGTGLMASRMGTLCARYSPRRLLLFSQGLYVAALLLIPLMPSLLWLLLPVFLYGAGQGLNVPTVQTRLLESVPGSQRGSVMAMNGMLLRIGQTAAPLLFSLLAERISLDAPFHAGLIVVAFLCLLTVICIPDDPPGSGADCRTPEF